ncbi:MAG TPA: Ig-like domain-containing protein [Candidatus Thermoplasmatota archaeon]|nr:Ig-like domain-containing protein [Candidatus Thermoplasmatota archaeon]
MKKNNLGKAAVSFFVLFVLLITSVQATDTGLVSKNNKKMESRGWYWKPSYPNYVPQGLPDFSQQQDQWKKIAPGPNNMIDSTVAGDDIYNPSENCIAPGPDCALNSTAVGDDVVEWAFCGPVAVANCFWWFDSKFADPEGTPGDGQDQFALVQDYGIGDDHTTTNVPLLIQNLARAMNTTEKGTTYVDDMHSAISDWFTTTGLTDKFTVQTYDRPTFSFIEGEIERSQDVILLLGDYNYIIGPLMVDQMQLLGPVLKVLQINTLWDSQGFIPTVTRLDAIEILLQSVSTFPPTDVEVNVYDNRPGNLLGKSTVNPGFLPGQTWIRFDFNPSISLTPGATYYFDVRQLVEDPHYYWSYDVGNPYPPGQAWKDNVLSSIDWAFKTEYYNPPPHSERKGGHYVTCAGVNSEDSMIAFSDPIVDIANPAPNDHNDAAYVSHDIYNVSVDAPQPDINTQWWLTDYDAGYNYTVVEQAVVICPVPDTTPPSLQITKPEYALYFLNKEIMPLSGGTLIIGKIDVNVNATDDDSGIDRVEFYVNLQLLGNDTTAPYSWSWSQPAFFRQTLTVKAFDKEGNVDSKEIEVWKFF